MRIGVLGGTFDPPHIGHIALAVAAIEQLDLDEVLFMPANQNPTKGRRVETSAMHRLGMVEALIKGSGNQKFAVSNQEITRGGPSYAVETLSELQMALPAEYWFLLGADALRTLPDWKQPQRLVKLCRLGVVVRPPNSAEYAVSRVPEEYQDKIDILEMDGLNVSSTTLRERLMRGVDVSEWIPIEVRQYIKSHRLYAA